MNICWVSSRNLDSKHGETHFAISNQMLRYLAEFDLSPIPVSTLTASSPQLFDLLPPKLIVLSGGESIGELNDRDRFETELLTLAKKNHTPVLGICRGMQLMGQSLGGETVELHGHVGTRHVVSGLFNGEVNSFHRFGFSSLPPRLEILAKCEDGTVEALLERDLRWLGIMWHPERESSFNKSDIGQIRRLLGI
jgi:gamma-glutamyl-gamma-aminobutyrate hydrolase PuuD